MRLEGKMYLEFLKMLCRLWVTVSRRKGERRISPLVARSKKGSNIKNVESIEVFNDEAYVQTEMARVWDEEYDLEVRASIELDQEREAARQLLTEQIIEFGRAPKDMEELESLFTLRERLQIYADAKAVREKNEARERLAQAKSNDSWNTFDRD